MRKKSISLMNPQWKLRFSSSSIVLLLLLLHLCASAQQIFVVDHPDKSKRLRYRENQKIVLQNKEGAFISGYIKNIGDSSLTIGIQKISLEEIKSLVVEHHFISTLSSAFVIAGTAYFGLDVFNAALNNDQPIISMSSLIPAASISAVGAVLGIFSQNRLRSSRGYRFRIIDTSP